MSVSGAIAATWLLANLLCVVAKDASNIHTVFVAGCNLHYQWQSLGVYHSHKKSGQPGPITRLLSCSERQTGLLKQRGDWDAWLEFGRTHLAPAYVDYRPSNNDSYRAYNKPLAIIHWLENAEPEEDWLLILDADQILHLPFVCKGEGHDEALRPFELECQRGSPISVHHPFLVGSTNELALKHLPGAQRRNDSEGGQPWGRYADQVGGVFLVHKEDLKLYMHDWLTLTEAVRDDPDAWNVAGDVSAQKPGHKVWIADLYGYVFAAAKHNVWHNIDPFAMGYPGAHSDAVMRVMHYTLTFNAVARTTAPTLLRSGSWSFFKHHHYSFETPLCPPWFSVPHPRHVKMVPKSISGVRSLAPSIKLLAVQEQTRLEDILAIETTNTLNEAFCARFESHCPAILDDAEFQLECGIVHDITEGIRQELLRMAAIPAGQPGAVCQGDEAACGSVTPEKCSRQFSHMAVMCPRACGIPCLPLLPPSQLSANNHSQVLEEAAVVPNPVATQASPRNPVSIDSTPSSSALSDPAPSNPSPGDSPSSSSPSVAEAMEAPSFNFTSPVYDQQW